MLSKRLIITAASEAFGQSVLGLLGSLNLNWPDHPPVLVYDIGLSDNTLSILKKHDVNVKKVPPFCPHWRKHFTWKIWCWNDAPATQILWLDAGTIVLSPLNEIFTLLEQTGYFVIPTYHLLTENASLQSCTSCGLTADFRNGRMTIAGGIIGFEKSGSIATILEQALTIAFDEDNIKATEPMHRHDQAIISLLLYKHFNQLILSDGLVYGGWLFPRQVPGQKIWVHRRAIMKKDLFHYINHISQSGTPYIPVGTPSDSNISLVLYKIISLIRKIVNYKSNDNCIYDGVKE